MTQSPAHSTDAPAQVGVSTQRKDAVDKVTGAALYAADIAIRDSLHGVAVRSERAHARIVSVDRDAALAAPGVVAVITSADLEGLFPRFGHIVADHPILAIDRVRYWGEPVALVVATSRQLAIDAAEQVIVRYEDLPAPMTPEEALAEDAIALHDQSYDGGDDSFAVLSGGPAGAATRHPNICHEVEVGWGDVEAAFAAAHHVEEGETRYPMLYAYAMEPYNAVASFSGDQLHVVTTAQHPYQVREDLARIFSLPYAKVRVEVPYIGGGYGSKSYTKVEPLAAVGAWVTGRRVKVLLTVEESIYTTRVDAALVRVRTAFDDQGTILAREFDLTLDSGAYADNSPLVLGKAANRCFGPYRIPALRVRARSVYTCTSPASSYRGFGAPQGNLAGETNLDRAAERLGIDPFEIRKRNLVQRGEALLPGKRPLDAKIADDLDLVKAQLEAAPPPPGRLASRSGVRVRGVGCRCLPGLHG